VRRHEVQAEPPDILVTNYSMLEYMLMRPLERPIFDTTRKWLEANPDETLTGKNPKDFEAIPGDLLLREPAATATPEASAILDGFDLQKFYSENDHDRLDEVSKIVSALGGKFDPAQWQASLQYVLKNFPPLNLLVNRTMICLRSGSRWKRERTRSGSASSFRNWVTK